MVSCYWNIPIAPLDTLTSIELGRDTPTITTTPVELNREKPPAAMGQRQFFGVRCIVIGLAGRPVRIDCTVSSTH